MLYTSKAHEFFKTFIALFHCHFPLANTVIFAISFVVQFSRCVKNLYFEVLLPLKL